MLYPCVISILAMITSIPAFLWAQQVVQQPSGPQDPISGLGGWTSCGLLSMVMGWLLLKHLPAKDAQLASLLTEKDAQIKLYIEGGKNSVHEIIDKNNLADGVKRADFQAWLKMVMDHCDKETTGMQERSRIQFEEFERIIVSLTDAVTGLQREVAESRNGKRGGVP